jgi:hypothetical protein
MKANEQDFPASLEASYIEKTNKRTSFHRTSNSVNERMIDTFGDHRGSSKIFGLTTETSVDSTKNERNVNLSIDQLDSRSD